jgi:hypothetical protein
LAIRRGGRGEGCGSHGGLTRRRLRAETEGDDLPGGPAGPGDGTEDGWRQGPIGQMRETEAGWRRGLRGRVGRLAAGPNGPEVKENSFSNKNLIFDCSEALEIRRRRFRINFEVGIFPKFF